jgi:hypothetical protein
MSEQVWQSKETAPSDGKPVWLSDGENVWLGTAWKDGSLRLPSRDNVQFWMYADVPIPPPNEDRRGQMNGPTERALIDAIDFLWVKRRHHFLISSLYKEGFFDACTDAKAAVRRLFCDASPLDADKPQEPDDTRASSPI